MGTVRTTTMATAPQVRRDFDIEPVFARASVLVLALPLLATATALQRRDGNECDKWLPPVLRTMTVLLL